MDQYVDELVEKYFRDAGWDTSKQNETKQNRSITSYDEHLLAGDAALQDGDLEAAEQHFASALKQVHDRDSPRLREEEKCLRKLGTVYVRRGVQTKDGQDFAKATALYNAALARGGNKHVLVDAIKKAERLFLSHTVGVDREPSLYDTDIEHKKRLEKYRAEVKVRLETIHNNFNPYQYDEDDPIVKEVEIKRAESVRDLFKDISKQRKDFIKDLVNECIETIGPPPCQYAIVGLGSQATELVTPYSDLEFAILIEENKDTSENKEYFQNLTCYLYLKIINLGETILPAVAIKSLNDFYSWQATDDSAESPTDGPTGGRAQGPTIGTAEGLSERPAKGPTAGSAEGPAESTTEGPPFWQAYRRALFRTEQLANDPTNSWFYDSVTPRGFAFDGAMPWASKTPFGRERTKTKPAVSLIQTPAGMAEFQQHDVALAHGYHLSSILRYVSYLTGDQTLVDEYIARVIQGLEKRDITGIRDFEPILTPPCVARKSFAVASLSKITEENLGHELTDRPLDVKKEIYRFPAVAVINLGLLIGVYAASVWDVIEEIEKKDDITKENAHHLKVLVSISGELRLRTYMELGAQKENLSGLLAIRSHLKDCEETFLKSVFYVPDQKMLFRYYYTARPLRKYIIDIIDPLALLISLKTFSLFYHKQDTFYDASPSVKADICRGILQFNAAIAHAEACLRELNEYQDTETSQRGQTQKLHLLDQRAAAYSQLGDHRKAISCLEEMLRVQQQLYGDDPMHKAFIPTYTRLVEAWGNLGEKEIAITYVKQMLMSLVDKGCMVPEIAATLLDLLEKDDIAPDDPDVAMLISFLKKLIKMLKTTHGEISAHQALQHLANIFYRIGDYTKAIQYTEESLRIRRTMYGQDTAHPDIAESLANLGSSLCESRNEHIKAARYYEEALEMNKVVYGADTPHLATADILYKLVVEWEHIGDHQKAISCCEQALQMITAIHGGDEASHPSIALVLRTLGSLWCVIGDNEKARMFLEQALKMHRELHGPTTPHRDTAMVLNSMGVVCGKSGDNFKEISFYKEALNMMQELLGERTNHPDIAMVLGNLGLAFHDTGEYTKSRQYFERALEINKGIHGEGVAHLSIAKSLYNLAAVYKELGDHTKAVQLYEDALIMTKTIHAPNEAHGGEVRHPHIAQILDRLGRLWFDVGDNEKARAFWEQALKMYQELYGPTTPYDDTAMVLRNMGLACLKAGENQKSLQYYEDALNMLKTIHGANETGEEEEARHPDIANILTRLGCLWYDVGDNEKASAFWEQALKMYQELYGPTTPHHDTALVLRNMGIACHKAGENQKSLQYSEEALNMLKTIHGANQTHGREEVRHPDIARILNDLGCLWDDVGNNEKARAFYEQALKMYQELYGPTTPHHDTALVLTNMGVACHKAGENQTSLQYYEDALSMLKTIHGANETGGSDEARHPDIAGILNGMGCLWYDVGDNAKARPLFEQALEMYQKLHGTTTPHHDTAMVLANMGEVLEKAGDHFKAISFYKEALKMRKEVLGSTKENPDIASLLGYLGSAYHKAGEHTKSLQYRERALEMIRGIHGKDAVQPTIVEALSKIAAVYEDLEEYTKAIKLYEDALDRVKSLHGANKTHPKILKLLDKLETVCNKAGDQEKASGYHEQTQALKAAVEGQENADNHNDIKQPLGE